MTSPIMIAPSLLAADFASLGQAVRMIDAAGADWLHLDVMDGRFVPNISFGPAVIRAIRDCTSKPFDCHLMIEQADPYIHDFAKAGAQRLTVHPEAHRHLDRTLSAIRDAGMSAGVALNPGSHESCLEYVLDKIDLVLVMTVNPGFGGQKFISAMLAKIAAIRRMIAGRPIYLQVDGGINAATAPQVIAAGADVLVAGSAVFGAEDPAAMIRCLRGDEAEA